MAIDIPEKIPNWIDGLPQPAADGDWFVKLNPATGDVLCHGARSRERDVRVAIKSALVAQPGWAEMPPVRRGEILHVIANAMETRQDEIARIVALETGKSVKEALGETSAAIAQARFMAGEGQRLYGRTTTSASPDKYAMTVRQPVGVAGLIIAANTPIANVAWKIFPALICGNAAVLKAADDTPATAWIMGEITKQAGLPDGVFNIIQGLGEEAGAPLVEDPDVGVISFTGSTEVGRKIAVAAGRRLAKVSLELGGKNPLVVCDDADLENAVKWSVLSAYSNAGQRCAAAGRIIVFDAVYDSFLERLVEETRALKVGPGNDDDFGPVINEPQLDHMLTAVDRARSSGATVHIGGHRMTGPKYGNGFYMAPTVIDGLDANAEISTVELFGPIACLYRATGFEDALAMANDSPYGLTASIHTKDFDRAMQFSYKVSSGVAVVNAGTYGSEPHMPFGGLRMSGNGSREPGTEALDIYSELKDIYLVVNPSRV